MFYVSPLCSTNSKLQKRRSLKQELSKEDRNIQKKSKLEKRRTRIKDNFFIGNSDPLGKKALWGLLPRDESCFMSFSVINLRFNSKIGPLN